MEPVEVLRQARDLIADPARWTNRGALARDSKGRVVEPQAKSARRWCALGAVAKIDGGYAGEESTYGSHYANIRPLYQMLDEGQVGFFNDTHTHAEVLDLFDRAIASLS